MKSKIKSPNQRVLILISILSIACFIPLALWQTHLSEINQSVNLWAANLQLGNEFTQVACIVSDLFDTTVMLVVSLPIAGLLFYRKHKADALLLVGVMGRRRGSALCHQNFGCYSKTLKWYYIDGWFLFSKWTRNQHNCFFRYAYFSGVAKPETSSTNNCHGCSYSSFCCLNGF